MPGGLEGRRGTNRRWAGTLSPGADEEYGADLGYWQRKWKEKAKVILQKRKSMDLEKKKERDDWGSLCEGKRTSKS